MSQRSVAIFTEGDTYTDLWGRVPLVELWKELCSKLTPTPPSLHVFGINKAQILALDETQRTPGSREALDVFVERMYQRHAFDIAILAFDGIPENQLRPGGCMRKEVNFILEHFVHRKQLSEIWVRSAEQLLEQYEQHPGCSRGIGRPPRVDLDILYMAPMFEGMLVSDESTVLHALGLKRRPKGWPKFDDKNLYPDTQILAHAVKFASKEVRRIICGDMKSHKHDWALQMIRCASSGAKLFSHPIAQRLRVLLA